MKYCEIRVTKNALLAVVSLLPYEKESFPDKEFWDSLRSTAKDLAQDNTIKAVVLDLSQLPEYEVLSSRSQGTCASQEEISILTAVSAWERLEKVTIAAVCGTIKNTLLNLLMMCDFAIVSEEATFILDSTANDSVINFYLPHYISVRNAREMLLLGKPANAIQAQKWGLIDSVVSADELLSSATAWAEQAAILPSSIIQQSKHSINTSYGIETRDYFSLGNL